MAERSDRARYGLWRARRAGRNALREHWDLWLVRALFLTPGAAFLAWVPVYIQKQADAARDPVGTAGTNWLMFWATFGATLLVAGLVALP